jgi:VanZ like family
MRLCRRILLFDLGVLRYGHLPLEGAKRKTMALNVREEKLNSMWSYPKLRTLLVLVAWAFLAVVAYATLMKSAFVYKLYYSVAPYLDYPSMGAYGRMEHLVVFAVVGALFSALYPRSAWRVCILLFLFIAGLEFFQTLTPDRHGTLHDALEKMIGGAVGVALVKFAFWRDRTHENPAAD